MKRKLFKLMCLSLILALLCPLAACQAPAGDTGGGTPGPSSGGASGGSSGGSGAAAETIRFAVMGPMTGDAASQGKQQELGVRLAVDEINAAGGVNGKMLAYEVYDDQLNTNQAVICAEKIISIPDYRFVITSISSGCSRAAYPTWETKDLPVISGINTADTITEQGFKNYLRLCYKDSANLVQLVDLAINKMGYERPAIFYTSSETDTSNFHQAVEILKSFGVEPVASAQIDANSEKDYNVHITSFMNAGADCYLNFSEYTPAALFLKQKAALGWDGQAFALSGSSNPQLITIAGPEAAEGFITMSGFDATNPDPRVSKFVTDYVALAGFEPGEWAAGAYDSIYLMAETLKQDEASSLHGNALIEWMRANTDYQGIMGRVTFDENGDNPTSAALILRVTDGKLVIYEP